VRPSELTELGSGSSRKTRLLLEAMHAAGAGHRYTPIEISEAALIEAAQDLADGYPWLEVHGHLGDFTGDLSRLPPADRRLLAFLGSTVGNLVPADRNELFHTVAGTLGREDAFLLGADLVKSPDVLVPAYDDAAAATAEFNRNLLHVLNREFAGDLPVEVFAHRAVWNATEERIEMHLVPTSRCRHDSPPWTWPCRSRRASPWSRSTPTSSGFPTGRRAHHRRPERRGRHDRPAIAIRRPAGHAAVTVPKHLDHAGRRTPLLGLAPVSDHLSARHEVGPSAPGEHH
jgi:hypothetical protein